ncbi:MAG: hypothetical protein WB777_13960, partial [Mycobacterium sp.]
PAAPLRPKPVTDIVAETAGALPTAGDGKPSPRPFSSVDARVVEANVLFWRRTLELRGRYA